jgi:hypothetical protein
MSSPFTVCRAAKLDKLLPKTTSPWLIESLWADSAVGILGGEPKCGKSFLALEIALAVASGSSCLGRFVIPRPGPVLFFAAEDSTAIVHQRVHAIARARRIEIAALDLFFLNTPALRLDHDADRDRLNATVERWKPRLVVLDPFVRLHAIDENSAGEVAPLLAYLRSLQRKFDTAVLLVHHSRKAAAHLRDGQALRGSSELHAWGDSNLYLRRRGPLLSLSIEQRAFASSDDLRLRLRAEDDAVSLEIITDPDPTTNPQSASAHQRVEQAIAAAANPPTLPELRATCRMRNSTLCQILNDLTAQGRVRRHNAAYHLAT